MTWILLGIGLGLVIGAVGVISCYLPSRAVANDFSHTYLTAYAATANTEVYDSALDSVNQTIDSPFVEFMPHPTNPPFLIWLSRPLTLFDPSVAFWIFVCIQILSIFLCLVMISSFLKDRLSRVAFCLGAGLACCSTPVFYHFWFSQFQLPLLALVFAGYCFKLRKRFVLATVLFTIAGMIKLYPLALLPLTILQSRKTNRVGIVITIIISIVAIVLISGLGNWLGFSRSVLPFLGQYGSGDFYNFTITSLLTGLLPASILSARLIGLSVASFVLILTWFMCVSVHQVPSRKQQDASFCILLLAAIICSPVAWVHYLVFAMYPMFLLATQIKETLGRQRFWGVFIFLVCLTSFNLAGRNLVPSLSGLPKTLLGHHPLYAMILLYVNFSIQLYQEKKHAKNAIPAVGHDDTLS